MSLFNIILDFLLPTTCSYCRSRLIDSPYPFLCRDCWNEFSFITCPICPTCGRPFGSEAALSASSGHECSACRLDPPAFDQAVSVGEFEGPLREAIHIFKYRPCLSLGPHLGTWMASGLRLVSEVDCVMPVPLHVSRLRHRGFNQSLILAHKVAGSHGLSLSYDNLVRIRPTRPQVDLSVEERHKNVIGAFSLRRPSEVEGRRILIVDDVFTTGATMNECASVLKLAGAQSVIALTLARTI